MNNSEVKAKLAYGWKHIPPEYVDKLLSHDWAHRKGYVQHKHGVCRNCEAMIFLDKDAADSHSPGDSSGFWTHRTEPSGFWMATNLARCEFEDGWAQERILTCNEVMMRRVLG